jgi:nucleoid-associated protein EbfC
MDLMKMMKEAQKMQQKMQTAQAALPTKIVEGSVAGGKIRCKANAAGDVLEIKIAREVVDPDDVEMLEQLILTAVKQALEKGRQIAAGEMGSVTAGLNLPGGLPF